MDSTFELLKGPLFALTFGVMILGLLRIIVIQAHTLIAGKGSRLRNAPWKKIFSDTFSWAFPFPHFIKGTVIFSSASFVFHIGLIIVPIFLADHALLWNQFFGITLPALNTTLADILTVTTIVCAFILLGCRILVARQRAVSKSSDYLLLLAIILPFVTGFLAAHPNLNPFPWNTLMVIHILSAELLFLLIPSTKLAHVVLFFFDRISAVHWQLRPGAGDRIATALFGEQGRKERI